MDKFKAPAWCGLKYRGIKDAIIGAAEIAGAQMFMSMSFIFRIDDFEKVEAFVKTNGKDLITKTIVETVGGKKD